MFQNNSLLILFFPPFFLSSLLTLSSLTLFLQQTFETFLVPLPLIWIKSVGETSEITMNCNKCETENSITVDLEAAKVKQDKKVSNMIKLFLFRQDRNKTATVASSPQTEGGRLYTRFLHCMFLNLLWQTGLRRLDTLWRSWWLHLSLSSNREGHPLAFIKG